MTLREQQVQLIRALVTGAPAPAGFAPDRVAAARQTLIAKRCREVARHWPALLADAGAQRDFLAWAASRPKTTSAADGLAFARERRKAGRLSPAAADELRAAQRRRMRQARR